MHSPHQFFTRYESRPKYLTNLITLSIQSYLTSEFSGGISEFTELPFGYDRSCIRRNLLLNAIGTKPKGEHTTFLRGGFLKGPEILLFRDSLANFSNTLSGFSSGD
jgi:hypothetical protein